MSKQEKPLAPKKGSQVLVGEWITDPVELAAIREQQKDRRSLALNLADENWEDMNPKDRLTHVSEVLADLASGEHPDAVQQLVDVLPADVLEKLSNALSHRLNGKAS